MRCYLCSDTYIKCSGGIELYNSCIGKYFIYLKEYFKCPTCGSLLLPKEMAKTVTQFENEQRNTVE